MILSMQDSESTVPNLQWVEHHETPPQYDEFPEHLMVKYIDELKDFLPLVEPDVYRAFRQMLQDPVKFDEIRLAMFQNNKILAEVSELAGPALWSGGYPHPCRWIMRDVVSELLSVSA
jgi:hypothetical protein